MRLLIEPEGREWRVYERATGDFSPTTARSSLIFEAEGIVRRLWHYPASWAAFSDAELLLLMDVRRPTPR